jgi:anti-sigma factor RsiW
VEPETIHDLTAAYALDALDPEEERAYEDHLARCPRCQEELAGFSETASMLAYAADSPAPPAALRGRIIQAAREERPNVRTLRPRWLFPAVSATAVVAVAAAIVLAVWVSSLSGTASDRLAAGNQQARVIDVVSQPGARWIRLSGERGAVVVAPTGEGALIMTRLDAAPRGHLYEAWVIENGKPAPAGVFQGGRQTTAVPLDRAVPNGSLVAVTVERRRERQPTTAPIASARIS